MLLLVYIINISILIIYNTIKIIFICIYGLKNVKNLVIFNLNYN